MPIPLVETNGRWTFDTKAGAQTVIDRRIGRNELAAIRTLLASVDAQHDYFERAKQANGSGEYAARLVSTPGRRDGLYWPVAEGEAESPLGPLIDAAQDAGYPGELVSGKPIPYEGYYFRILKAQGPNGDGGARSYVQLRSHDRRLRIDRLAGGVQVEWHHDVHRRPRWRCVPEGSGTRDGAHRRRNDDVRPGPCMVTCRDDERLTEGTSWSAGDAARPWCLQGDAGEDRSQGRARQLVIVAGLSSCPLAQINPNHKSSGTPLTAEDIAALTEATSRLLKPATAHRPPVLPLEEH